MKRGERSDCISRILPFSPLSGSLKSERFFLGYESINYAYGMRMSEKHETINRKQREKMIRAYENRLRFNGRLNH